MTTENHQPASWLRSHEAARIVADRTGAAMSDVEDALAVLADAVSPPVAAVPAPVQGADRRLARPCLCGHAQEEHAGQTHRGICYVCYRKSDWGMRSYCGRFRLPMQGADPTGPQTAADRELGLLREDNEMAEILLRIARGNVNRWEQKHNAERERADKAEAALAAATRVPGDLIEEALTAFVEASGVPRTAISRNGVAAILGALAPTLSGRGFLEGAKFEQDQAREALTAERTAREAEWEAHKHARQREEVARERAGKAVTLAADLLAALESTHDGHEDEAGLRARLAELRAGTGEAQS